jgi:hypothetical protein
MKFKGTDNVIVYDSIHLVGAWIIFFNLFTLFFAGKNDNEYRNDHRKVKFILQHNRKELVDNRLFEIPML